MSVKGNVVIIARQQILQLLLPWLLSHLTPTCSAASNFGGHVAHDGVGTVQSFPLHAVQVPSHAFLLATALYNTTAKNCAMHQVKKPLLPRIFLDSTFRICPGPS